MPRAREPTDWLPLFRSTCLVRVALGALGMTTFSSLLRLNAIPTCCCVLAACGGSGPAATDGGTDGPGANRPPVISGTPPTTATAGQAYSFTPTASDPDGQTLTFTIANRPAWATFNGSTGQLSGSPSSVFNGNYPAIVITVSDGTATASLPSFAISLRDVTTGTATLRWDAPTQNVDGTPISNLSGFMVHYGTSATRLTTVLEIPSPNTTEATVEELTPATWYFGITAYNTLGVESAMSEIRSKTIQ